MDFFWSGLAPFTVLVAFGMAALVLALGTWSPATHLTQIAKVAGLVVGVSVLLNLPVQYYLVRNRLERPIRHLSAELLGHRPWQPEGDLLLAPIRRAVENMRELYAGARNDLELARERAAELQQRLDAQVAAERFTARVAESLRTAEPVAQFAAELAELIRAVWPAQYLVLLHRDESQPELDILYYEVEGRPVRPDPSAESTPRYRKASLPPPVKEALRRGFYSESGLPFSQDPAFPAARSFVAMALDHRGPGAGILLLASSILVPPSPEPLRKAQPLLSIGFSRSMYLRELDEAAIRDGLTGAFTYDHFLSLLRHEVARSNRYGRPVSCIILDIDGLRRVNEAYGARSGDQVIAEVALLVKGLIRSSDIMARISGGRLALLLPEANEEAARVVAERVRAKIEEHPFIVRRGAVERLTVSLGIGVHPPHGVTALTLVDAAHQALRAAKEEGRNRVAVAEDPSPAGEESGSR